MAEYADYRGTLQKGGASNDVVSWQIWQGAKLLKNYCEGDITAEAREKFQEIWDSRSRQVRVQDFGIPKWQSLRDLKVTALAQARAKGGQGRGA
jgi:hypothetical protein